MKYTLTILLSFVIFVAKAQPVCCTWDSCDIALVTKIVDSTLTAKDTIYKKRDGFGFMGCIVRPVNVNGTNQFYIENTGGHKRHGFKDSVGINGGIIELYYENPVDSIITFSINNDERLIAAGQTASGYPSQSSGGMLWGCRAMNDRLMIWGSEVMDFRPIITYDSVNDKWNISSSTVTPINVNSFKSKIKFITGRYGSRGETYVDVVTDSFYRVNGSFMGQDNAWGAPYFGYKFETASSGMVRVMWIDYTTGLPITWNKPPHNCSFILDMGSTFGYTDIIHKDFGRGGNFQVRIDYKNN